MDNNPPAFPVSTARTGMTLLDYFAGQALPWALAQTYLDEDGKFIHPHSEGHFKWASRSALNAAQAMLSERRGSNGSD